jgi:hypothetical protein
VSVCILGVAIDHLAEVLHGFLVPIDHLVSFSSLVHVKDVSRVRFNAAIEREDRLLKLLLTAVSKPNVIEDIAFVSTERFVLESFLENFDGFFVLLVREVVETKLVENLWIKFILVQRFEELLSAVCKRAHFVVTLGGVAEELHVCGLLAESFVELLNGELELALSMVALAETIPNAGLLSNVDVVIVFFVIAL